MAKRKKRGLPYRRVRTKHGQTYYYSKHNGKRIPKSSRTPDWDKLALRQVYSDKFTVRVAVKNKDGKFRLNRSGNRIYKDKTITQEGLSKKRIRGVRKFIYENKILNQNPLDDSPGLARLFRWLHANEPALFAPVVREYGGRPQAVAEQLELDLSELPNANPRRAAKKKRKSRGGSA